MQLIKSGERERLKQLLRDKLTECGWRDEVKQRCRGDRKATAGLVEISLEAIMMPYFYCQPAQTSWFNHHYCCSNIDNLCRQPAQQALQGCQGVQEVKVQQLAAINS